MSSVKIINLPSGVPFRTFSDAARRAGLDFASAVNVMEESSSVEFTEAIWDGNSISPSQNTNGSHPFIDAYLKCLSEELSANAKDAVLTGESSAVGVDFDVATWELRPQGGIV